MSLLLIVGVIVFFGLLVYVINRFLPMDQDFKRLLTVVVIIGICAWIFFGVFGGHMPDIRIGG